MAEVYVNFKFGYYITDSAARLAYLKIGIQY
eukprot:SAG11_NODE_16075_length_557_cov_1.349345_2_plen_30_part_01